jgi:phage-related protein
MGLLVSVLPAIERAPERVEQVTIPGRRGAVTILEGADILEPIARTCSVYARNDRSYRACLDWLRGEGEAVFSNEPDRVYYARIIEAVSFQPDGNSLRKADIVFLCDPYKGQYPKENNISLTDSVEVFNPGDVAAKPIITMPPVEPPAEEGEDSIGVITISRTVDGETVSSAYEFHYKDVTHFELNCETGLCRSNLGFESGDIFDPMNSGLPEIPTGACTITATGFTNSIAIEPRWRWV